MKKIFLIILIILSFLVIILLMRKDSDPIKYPYSSVSNDTYDFSLEKKMEVEPALDLWKFKLSDEYQKLAKTKTIRVDYKGGFNINKIQLNEIEFFGSKFNIDINYLKAKYFGFFEFDFENLLLKGNVNFNDIDVDLNIRVGKKITKYNVQGDLKFNIYVVNDYIYFDFHNSKIKITNLTYQDNDNNIIALFNGKYKLKSKGAGTFIKEIRDYYINYLNVPGNLVDTIKEILNLKLYENFYVYNFTQKMIKDSLDSDKIYNAIKHLFDEKYQFKLLINLHHKKARVFIVDKTKDKDFNNNIEFYLDGYLGEMNKPNSVNINIDFDLFKEINSIKDSVILIDSK